MIEVLSQEQPLILSDVEGRGAQRVRLVSFDSAQDEALIGAGVQASRFVHNCPLGVVS